MADARTLTVLPNQALPTSSQVLSSEAVLAALKMILTDAPLNEVLTGVTRLIEAHSDRMLCSIFLVEKDGLHLRYAAAPNLPEPYRIATDGATIGPGGGPCSMAVYRRQAVIVADFLSDPAWANFRDKPVPAGLLAGWSSPIISHDGKVLGKLEATLRLKDVDLSLYDAIHVAGGRGATFDLFPNEDVAKALEYFWAKDKIVGDICHGAIALGNIPNRIRGLQVTGFPLEADRQLQAMFGSGFLIPHYPQTVLQETGAVYKSTKPYAPKAIIDGKLITGQDQASASEYALALLHMMTGHSPVSTA
jgi:putative intracellular protease/amidase